VEITLVKAARAGEEDRAYLEVDGETRRGPVHVVHDLPHLVVESLFDIRDGLWGELAAGRHEATARATTARDTKLRKRGRIVSGAAPGARTDEWLSAGHRRAKTITNAVVNRWGDGLDTPAGVRARLGDGAESLARVDDESIERAIRGVRQLERRWSAVPAGGVLRLRWPLPQQMLDESN
jgi:hypothetical protein